MKSKQILNLKNVEFDIVIPSEEERMEIDFLTVRPYADAATKLRVSPIEVKSGKRYSPVSLNKFKAKFGKRVGTEYVLHAKPLRIEGDRVFLPLYMSICL